MGIYKLSSLFRVILRWVTNTLSASFLLAMVHQNCYQNFEDQSLSPGSANNMGLVTYPQMSQLKKHWRWKAEKERPSLLLSLGLRSSAGYVVNVTIFKRWTKLSNDFQPTPESLSRVLTCLGFNRRQKVWVTKQSGQVWPCTSSVGFREMTLPTR